MKSPKIFFTFADIPYLSGCYVGKTGFLQTKFEKFDLTFQAIMISGKNGYLRKKNIRP